MTILSRNGWAGKGGRTGLLSCRTSGGGWPAAMSPVDLVTRRAQFHRANNRRTWPIVDEEEYPDPHKWLVLVPRLRSTPPLLDGNARYVTGNDRLRLPYGSLIQLIGEVEKKDRFHTPPDIAFIIRAAIRESAVALADVSKHAR